MTPPLLPLCEDCDQEARAPRSRRCNPCRKARKAAQKATWQREHRDKRREDTRPIRIPRTQADTAIERALSAVTALDPLKAHLVTRATTSRAARDHLAALTQTETTLRDIASLLTRLPSQQGLRHEDPTP